MILVPDVVSPIVVALYAPAIIVGLIVALIGLFGISLEKGDLQVLILTDIVGIAMLIIVAAVGTDLAESLILPGLVVELAEILAICEILMSREMRKSGKSVDLIPTPLNFDMEILTDSPSIHSNNTDYIRSIPLRIHRWCNCRRRNSILCNVPDSTWSTIRSLGRYCRSIWYCMVFMACRIFDTIRIPTVLVC